VLSGDLAKTMPELGLFQIDDLDGVSLGAAVLPHHPAGEALRRPVTLLQEHNSPAATLRAEQFPVAPKGAPHGTTRSHCFAEACG